MHCFLSFSNLPWIRGVWKLVQFGGVNRVTRQELFPWSSSPPLCQWVTHLSIPVSQFACANTNWLFSFSILEAANNRPFNSLSASTELLRFLRSTTATPPRLRIQRTPLSSAGTTKRALLISFISFSLAPSNRLPIGIHPASTAPHHTSSTSLPPILLMYTRKFGGQDSLDRIALGAGHLSLTFRTHLVSSFIERLRVLVRWAQPPKPSGHP